MLDRLLASCLRLLLSKSGAFWSCFEDIGVKLLGLGYLLIKHIYYISKWLF